MFSVCLKHLQAKFLVTDRYTSKPSKVAYTRDKTTASCVNRWRQLSTTFGNRLAQIVSNAASDTATSSAIASSPEINEKQNRVWSHLTTRMHRKCNPRNTSTLNPDTA
jgi:hypothetical protein